MVRIVHTADNHIGMSFNSSKYPEAVSPVLAEERIEALKTMVTSANQREANFLVVAGDLFDSLRVSVAQQKKTCEVLMAFEGYVLIMPGNHDFYEEGEDKFWHKFLRHDRLHKITLLSQYKPYDFEIEDTTIIFYPAPCRSKHSADNEIGWVKNIQVNKKTLNIGVAHGNIEGLGMGADRYFNMSPDELKKSPVDFWLLGHIHVPYPPTPVDNNPGFFMPATHTPDGFDRRHPGYCWYLEISADKKIKMEQWVTGKMRFDEWSEELYSEKDIQRLQLRLNKVEDKNNTLLKLLLKGRLSKNEKEGLSLILQKYMQEYLLLLPSNEVKLNIDPEFINEHYSSGSIPHRLLTELAEEDREGLSLQLLVEMMQQEKGGKG